MDWTNKNIHPSKVVQVGDEVEVVFWTSTKSVVVSPWASSSASPTHGKTSPASSTRVTRSPVPSKSITDFGIFIGLDGGIDGLVHLSDISWNETGEEAVRRFKKGDELEAVILSVDPERERISLASSSWKTIVLQLRCCQRQGRYRQGHRERS